MLPPPLMTPVYDLAAKAMSITGCTFHEEVEDVLANDNHAVVLAQHRFTRNGSPKAPVATLCSENRVLHPA
jgi:hypothetical protein